MQGSVAKRMVLHRGVADVQHRVRVVDGCEVASPLMDEDAANKIAGHTMMVANTFNTSLAVDRVARKARELTMADKISRSAIKYVDIQAAPEKVYTFLSNPLNWPQYAVVNLRSVSPGENEWFHAVTKFGAGEIRVNGVKEFGILDHVWKDPQASWTVYSRVVPNGGGSTVMMTLFQPAVMRDAQFDGAMKEMDIEMAKLKDVLER